MSKIRFLLAPRRKPGRDTTPVTHRSFLKGAERYGKKNQAAKKL
jgi:hypothetical protein